MPVTTAVPSVKPGRDLGRRARQESDLDRLALRRAVRAERHDRVVAVVPCSALLGTVRTPVALAIVIVTSALMPARASAGALVRVTVTGKATTPDEPSPATGEMAVDRALGLGPERVDA